MRTAKSLACLFALFASLLALIARASATMSMSGVDVAMLEVVGEVR